jgi:hypothetical protein
VLDIVLIVAAASTAVYVTTARKSWQSLDHDVLRADMQARALWDSMQWNDLDGDGRVRLYNDTVAALLDTQIPASTKTCRRRPSNVWFERRRGHFELWSRWLLVLASFRTLTDHKSWSVSVKVISIFSIESVCLSGSTVLNPTDISLVVCGSRLTRYWVAVEVLPLRSTPAPSTATLTTKLLESVRRKNGAPPPEFTAPPGCNLWLFRPVSVADVVTVVGSLPFKQCSLDPIPTRLLQASMDILAPFLSRMFCWSLEHGVVP